jgi:hypothetical protein
MAHAAVRVANGSIPQSGAFLDQRGWPQGVRLVRGISSYELIAGTLMALGWRTRWMTGNLAMGFGGHSGGPYLHFLDHAVNASLATSFARLRA